VAGVSNTEYAFRIGIDLGGTKIEAIALDRDGHELLRRRIPTPPGDYRAILEAVTGLVASVEADTGAQGTIGIGTPGALSPATGLLRNSNSVCLNGRPLLQDLEALLGPRVRIANDADCFALSEATDGAAAGVATVFGVIVGTGTGGGLVVNGRLLTGINAIAGEWGHNPLPWPRDEERPGPDCYCGKQGCIETWLSGPGLQRSYQLLTGHVLSPADIARLDDEGETEARQVLDAYVDRMARALATVINLLDPDVIVLGGGVGNIRRLYRDVPARWTDYIFSDVVRTRLVAPGYGDSSGVRGAAWLWPSEPADDLIS